MLFRRNYLELGIPGLGVIIAKIWQSSVKFTLGIHRVQSICNNWKVAVDKIYSQQTLTYQNLEQHTLGSQERQLIAVESLPIADFQAKMSLTMSRKVVIASVFYLCVLMTANGFSNINKLRITTVPISTHGITTRKLFSASPTVEQAPFPTIVAPNTARLLRGTDFVSAVMRTTYPRVFETETVSAAVESMRIANKGSVLVFSEDNVLSGIFTERDFVFKIMDNESAEKTTLISSVMTPRSVLIVANAETSINECVTIMQDNKIRHLPILNYRGDTVGIVSLRDIIRVLHSVDMAQTIPQFFGSTLDEIEEQAKVLANKLSLEAGEESSKQDILRAGFVATAALVGAALLQGNWIHDHEWLSMSLVFLLGYIGIVFENLFEFNKAAIALLMATALWTIFAGDVSFFDAFAIISCTLLQLLLNYLVIPTQPGSSAVIQSIIEFCSTILNSIQNAVISTFTNLFFSTLTQSIYSLI